MTYNKQDKTLAEKATETVKGAMHKVGEILHMTPKIEKFKEQFHTAKKNYDNYNYEKEYSKAAQSNTIKGLEERIEIRKAYESLIEDHTEAIANLTKELYHELEKYEKEFMKLQEKHDVTDDTVQRKELLKKQEDVHHHIKNIKKDLLELSDAVIEQEKKTKDYLKYVIDYKDHKDQKDHKKISSSST